MKGFISLGDLPKGHIREAKEPLYGEFKGWFEHYQLVSKDKRFFLKISMDHDFEGLL